MISPDHQFVEGDEAFVPFWIVLDHIDPTHTDAFVRVRVANVALRRMNSPDGVVSLPTCDIEIKQDLIVNSIPTSYLIPPAQLKTWAHQIAQWFESYPDKQSSPIQSS